MTSDPVKDKYTMSYLYRKLLHKSYVIYKQHLKKSGPAKLFIDQLVKLGFVKPQDLQTARLEYSKPTGLSSVDTHLCHSSCYRYSQEISAVQVPSFHLSPPLNFQVLENLGTTSCINVLLPSLQVKHMSGGPNTALLFASLLAEAGEKVRLIACDTSTEGEVDSLYNHMDSLLRRPVSRDKIELIDAFDRSKAVYIGVKDIFFATAWWTAQIAKFGCEKTIYKSFIYLIQDFEPILHEASTFYARALETYSLPHISLVNTKLLLDHLVKEKSGCYANEEFVKSALVFEPAIDRNYYFSDITKSSDSNKKVLLFYARPTVARRNLFEIGIVALRQAVASGVITNDEWEVWAMGEKLPPVPLGNEVYLRPLPWLSFEEYAKRVRTADLLLSLMLSPHPSYPPLEMAASGKLVVTNSYSVKTFERLKSFSNNIIVADPTPYSIGLALEKAACRINAGLPSYDPRGLIELPQTWEESLSKVIPNLISQINSLRSTPPGISRLSFSQGNPHNPQSTYEYYRKSRLNERRNATTYKQKDGLLSFVTSVYDTPATFLLELGNSIFVQDGGLNFEWLILDNGSSNPETLCALEVLTSYPNVRLKRVERNLGIIGGMRYLLENAKSQYIMPLDSDDLVEPDCVHVVTHHIVQNDYPAVLYTDEDKVEGRSFREPYFKPDWDPVLFLHSCYIAHLCVIDREKALTLNLYSDKSAEGCHDWDSFIRFMNAGYIPHHIPEVLYSWRIHSSSTSGNISSKGYITDSHRAVLQKFLDSNKSQNFELTFSPFFNHNVDWCFKHKQNETISCETVILPLPSQNSFLELLQKVEGLECELVNLRWREVTPGSKEWLWDAIVLLRMFPDAVIVGGNIYKDKTIINGPSIFGFNNGFDCPDIGKSIDDPGYFAWLFKPRSVSAVPLGHCVIKRDFLIGVLRSPELPNISLSLLGPWLGAVALENQKRVIFSPFMNAKGSRVPENNISSTDHSFFLSRFWHLFLNSKFYYSSRLGLSTESAYQFVDNTERFNHIRKLQSLTLPYHQWLQWQIDTRLKKYLITDSSTTISIITTIYENTDFFFLEELSKSIANQTVKLFEWVIVAHGPIDADLLSLWHSKFSSILNIVLITETQPLSIMEAMHRALSGTSGDYIVPIDADDLITHDALQILLYYIKVNPAATLLYSDEDMLIDNQPCNPYLRADFDPVLNLDSSYIWHLCAIKRQEALQHSLYSDLEATWCHDWNTIFHLLESSINHIVHIPEILYHWRQHKKSTTNNNNNIHENLSLQSVKHVLEKQISKLPRPELYTVSQWPVNRGSNELYITRKNHELPNFISANDDQDIELGLNDPNSIIVFTQQSVFIDDSTVYPEVARLFELHSHVGAVGGLTVDSNSTIIDSCYVSNSNGVLENPWLGQELNHSSPYAIAMKAQTVSSTGNALAFFRASALKQCGLFPLSLESKAFNKMIEICADLEANNWAICFSPLVLARAGVCTLRKYIYEEGSLNNKSSSISGRYGISRNFVN